MLSTPLHKILFLDIETVPQKEFFDELPTAIADLWTEKYAQLKSRNPEKYPYNSEKEAFQHCAGIYAEFGKIVCISVGYIHLSASGEKQFRSKSFFSDDEKLLLSDFCGLLNSFFISREHTFCGHNIKEFDIPYICRRLLVNRLPVPIPLQITGKKPWEVPFIDTLELWKFGDYKNYTSLKLLTAIFDIPTPKDDIDGSRVAEVYYREKNLQRIANYCQKDVLATAQLYLCLDNQSMIDADCVKLVE